MKGRQVSKLLLEFMKMYTVCFSWSGVVRGVCRVLLGFYMAWPDSY